MPLATNFFGEDGGDGFFTEWFEYGGAPILDNWRIEEGSLSFEGLQTEGNSVISEALSGNSWVGLMRELAADIEGTRHEVFKCIDAS